MKTYHKFECKRNEDGSYTYLNKDGTKRMDPCRWSYTERLALVHLLKKHGKDSAKIAFDLQSKN